MKKYFVYVPEHVEFYFFKTEEARAEFVEAYIESCEAVGHWVYDPTDLIIGTLTHEVVEVDTQNIDDNCYDCNHEMVTMNNRATVDKLLRDDWQNSWVLP